MTRGVTPAPPTRGGPNAEASRAKTAASAPPPPRCRPEFLERLTRPNTHTIYESTVDTRTGRRNGNTSVRRRILPSWRPRHLTEPIWSIEPPTIYAKLRVRRGGEEGSVPLLGER